MARETPQISKLDTKVQVKSVQTGKNELLEAITTEVLVCDTLAAAEVNGGQRSTDESVQFSCDAVYTIRRRPGIMDAADLLLYDAGRKFTVESVRKIGRSHLALYCTAYADALS